MITDTTLSEEKNFFDKITDLGHSNKVTYLIWLWYHPKAKCSPDILK